MFYKGPIGSKTTKLGNNNTATENQRTRGVGYLRVSTEGQAQEGVSLDAQRIKITAYAQAMEINLVDLIADGKSAKTLERPGLQKALTMLRTGQADALIVVKLDRLTRSVKDLGSLLDNYFADGTCSLLSVSDSIDTRSPSGRLVLNVLGSVAQWEREAIVDRTKEALTVLRAQGVRVGNAGYGYRYSRIIDAQGRRHVEPDPDQQKGVRQILEWFDAGMPVREIALRLEMEGYKKPRSERWHPVQLYRILKREGRLPQVIRIRKPRRAESKLVRDRGPVSAEARKLRNQGLSLRQIGKRLAASGYGPPRGSRWFPSTIAMLLEEHQAA